uniref:HEPN domain-containing protein n=1 Tax=Thermodesulfobacterium geofontis TaxID=1295609 RepID=A0A7V4JPF4_9BACT
MKTAKDCLKDGNYYATAFFAQQAAEKSLKGFLYAQGYRALITHSVVELLEESSKVNEQFKQFLDLNFYPSGAPYKFYTKEVAQRCLNYAELILKEVKKYLRK